MNVASLAGEDHAWLH